jgi:hypothetical protein
MMYVTAGIVREAKTVAMLEGHWCPMALMAYG